MQFAARIKNELDDIQAQPEGGPDAWARVGTRRRGRPRAADPAGSRKPRRSVEQRNIECWEQGAADVLWAHGD